MAKMVIDDSTLKGLADAIRKVNGKDRSYTATEMIEAVTTIMDSAVYVLVDEKGNEYPAIYIDDETVLTAGTNDIRKGTTAVIDEGVVTGEKEIPAYITNEGYKLIPNGAKFAVAVKEYDYKKLQAVICTYNTSMSNSVAVEKVAINGSVYPVKSTVAESTITVNAETMQIDFGIVNNSGAPCLIRYFMYKEVY